MTKVIHDSTSEKILVVCFTNHALDQFLEDLMDIGIPSTAMVRLGGKSTDRTKPLVIRKQVSGGLDRTQWKQIDTIKGQLELHETRFQDAFSRFRAVNVQKTQLMEYLEFSSEDLPFFDAFTVPKGEENDMTRVGKKGKAMDTFYLLDQ